MRAFRDVSWARHFGKLRCGFRGGAAFLQRCHGRDANPTGTDVQAGVCRFRGRGSAFARSDAQFVAGAALLQGAGQILWRASALSQGQVQTGATFARSCVDVLAGAIFARLQISWQAQRCQKITICYIDDR